MSAHHVRTSSQHENHENTKRGAMTVARAVSTQRTQRTQRILVFFFVSLVSFVLSAPQALRAQMAGAALVLRSPSGAVLRLLKLTRLERVFQLEGVDLGG